VIPYQCCQLVKIRKNAVSLGKIPWDRFLADPSVLLLAPPVREDPPTAALGEDWSEEDLELEEELVDERG